MIGDPWQRQRLLDAFPFLHATPEEFRAELFAQVALVRLPIGQLICYDGAHCTQLPLVLTGTGIRLDREPLAGGLRRSRCGAVPAPGSTSDGLSLGDKVTESLGCSD